MTTNKFGDDATGAQAPTIAKAKPERINYRFVTNIRFVSMVGIVALHSEAIPVRWTGGHLNVMFNQFGKFATVCFFLISGFLLGDRLEDASPVEYMKRRLRTTALPWAIWASVYLVMMLAVDRIARGSEMRTLKFHFGQVLFGSAYWFVPNILFSLATLLVFRRWLNSLWMGAFLAVATLTYGINLYTEWWSDQRHTSAWAGFILFLWGGYQLRRHLPAARAVVERISWSSLVAAACVTYGLALGETWWLWHTHPPDFDFLSTLRVSNLIYSLVVFTFLFKFERKIEPPGMDARKYTFGIYLLHTISFAVVSRAFKVVGAKVVGVSALDFSEHVMEYVSSPAARFLVQVLVFAIVYFSSWAGVVLITRTRFSRFIGARE